MTYRELLQSNANFRRLWLGQVVSEIGDWLNNIAVLALAVQAAGPGREGRAMAIYAVSRHLPLFLFGPVAGVVVDRTERRRVMIVSDVARSVLALGFLLAGPFSTLPVIYAVGASLFIAAAFFNTAKRAAIPTIVHDREELLSANSLSASTTAATIAVGSALGGIVATFMGRTLVFILNAATFLLSAELIRRMRVKERRGDAETRGRGEEERDAKSGRRGDAEKNEDQAVVSNLDEDAASDDVTVKQEEKDFSRRAPASTRPRVSAFSGLKRAWVDFREGLRYVRRVHVLSAIFIVAAGWGLGNGVARALYSIFGAQLGEQTAVGFVARPVDFGISVLFVAMGLGGVLGAPLARRFNAGSERGLASRMGRSMIFDGLGLLAFSWMPSLWGAALVLVFREINFSIWWTAQQTIIMSRTENKYAGRVFASYETVTTLMMVGSILVSGLAADRYGIHMVAATGGMIIALSGALWFILGGRERKPHMPNR